MTSLSEALPKDCLDLCFGEAHVIRQSLLKHFSFPDIQFNSDEVVFRREQSNIVVRDANAFNYPHPSGYQPLVRFLEAKHKAPVIITNGAKQALGAMFYVVRKSNGLSILRSRLGYHEPTWGLIKPLAEAHGIECGKADNFDCFLSIMPNNPDGMTYDLDYGKKLAAQYKKDEVPFVHDAAYYTPAYLPDNYVYGNFGDVQIYSISKMFGLSSLRLGYIVFNDERFYKPVQEYMEMMTVGVSTMPQICLLELLQDIANNPKAERRFIVDARNALYQAKFLCRTIRKDILDVPENLENTVGMFLWARTARPDAFKRANILVSECGKGYVRLNLAVPLERLIEAIERLNAV
jgi:histidinol-phosphate/aromatic aminotransferase/cobyric acid decarboxylase-like protein